MEFPGFLGNAPVKEALSRAFSAGRFPHALLLQGEPGTGKGAFAQLVAQALVCRRKDRAPCGECPSCVRAKAGSHPDIRVVEGSGATRSLTVEQVKELTADAYRAPEEADVSVYILQMGTKPLEPAQNKLLKLIEEPPAHGVFLLLCRSAEQLLPTIRSRVQSFLLQPPAEEEAAAFVAAREDVPLERARELARLCGGNIGRMLQELAGGEEAQAFSIAVALAQGLLETGEHPMLLAAAPLQKDRELFREVLARLSAIFRDGLVLRAGGSSLLGGAPQLADKLGDLPMKRLIQLPAVVEEARQGLERNANMAQLVTEFCARLREAAGR